jgi:hypothetical protein
MDDPRPTRADKFSFGPWTVGWQARVPELAVEHLLGARS